MARRGANQQVGLPVRWRWRNTRAKLAQTMRSPSCSVAEIELEKRREHYAKPSLEDANASTAGYSLDGQPNGPPQDGLRRRVGRIVVR